MMSRAMLLSRAEAEAFWPVYREYEREREQLEGCTVRLIDDYMESYRTLEDAKARALLRRYAEQLQAKLPARQVAGFVLTELQLLELLDRQRTADLGLIP